MEEGTQLHRAVASRLLWKISSLLDGGNDIEVVDDSGQTALHLATKSNFGCEVGLLLERGANVNVKDSKGYTPLHFSVLNKNINVVEKLLNGGSDTKYKDEYGRTPLHLAALTGDWEIFDHLLRSKADCNALEFEGKTPLEILISQEFNINNKCLSIKDLVNVKNSKNETPMHHAVRKSCANLVEVLLEAGAEVEIQDSNGKSLLHIVTESAFQNAFSVTLEQGEEAITDFYNTLKQQNSVLAVRFLLEKGKTELKNNCSVSSEIIPGTKGRIVEVLLKHGANIETQNLYNETPLLSAVKNYSQYNNDESAIQMLLAKGADIFVKDKWGRGPLHYAISNIRTVHSLLDKGADIEATDHSGRTPLQRAIIMYRDLAGKGTLVINELLNRGANVSTSDRENNTPLHLACTNHELVQILLTRGADVEATNEDVETPLFKAVKCSSLAFNNDCELSINLLLAKGADINTKDEDGRSVLHLSKTHISLFLTLLDRGADVNAKDGYGETPLHLADSLFKFEQLLARGANLDFANNIGITPLQMFISRKKMVPLQFSNLEGLLAAEDKDGSTPLHLAVKNSCENFVKKLLERGANVNLKDKDGGTPLHNAAMIDNYTGAKIMKELLKHEPIVNMQNSRGETPLLLSCFNNKVATAEALMLSGARLDLSDDYGESPLILNPRQTEPVRKKILEHIIKFKTADLKEELQFDLDYYNDVIIDNLERFDNLSDLQDLESFDVTCLKELERMKINPPLYGILSYSKKKDPSYASNRSIKETIESSSLDSQFPIYSSVLRVKFKEAEKRNVLLTNATVALENIMTVYLPVEIRRRILSELSNKHLKHIIMAELL